MSIVLLAFFLMCFFSLTEDTESIKSDYLSKRNVQPIKGMFVMFVFMRHFLSYIPLNQKYIPVYLMFHRYTRQLVVVPFIFLSGYGVRTNYLAKKERYLDSYVWNRVVRTWFNFRCAVCMFIISNVCIGKHYPIKAILLAFTGWQSIGNSNWYILFILCMYVSGYIAFSAGIRFKQIDWLPHVIIIALSFLYIFIMIPFRPDYCYNTALVFSFGTLYAYYRSRVDKLLLNNDVVYRIALRLSMLAFVMLHKKWMNSLWIYELTSIRFALSVVIALMKIRVSNSFLKYLGDHTFSVYMFQRLPMNVLKTTGVAGNTFRYFFLCLVITLIIAFYFDRITANTWKTITANIKGERQ